MRRGILGGVRRARAILVTHTHWDHLLGVAQLAAATGAPVYAPRDERDRLAEPETAGHRAPVDAHDPEHLVAGGDTDLRRRHRLRGRRRPGPHLRPRRLLRRGGALLRRRPLRRLGRAHRPPRLELRRSCSRRSRRSWSASRRTPSSTPGTARRRRSPPSSRATRSSRSCARERALPGAARHARRAARRRALVAARPHDRGARRRCYGWRRIQTPGFEDTGLFARTAGEASDVVNKEMYTFTDRGERSLTLRPEGTAPIARAYVEHGLHREPQPVKAYTIAPMYRYGRPGRGRYREHWQLSVEALGSADPALDAEVLQLYAELLRRLGVTQWTLHLNSIGDANCRPAYVARLNEWLDAHDDVLDEEARHKRADEPAPGLRREEPGAPRRARGRAARSATRSAPPARSTSTTVRAAPRRLRRPVRRSTRRSCAGWTTTRARPSSSSAPDENANSTICGGGRYDGLVAADRRAGHAWDRLRRAASSASSLRSKQRPRRRSRAARRLRRSARTATRTLPLLAELRGARARAPTPTTRAARTTASSSTLCASTRTASVDRRGRRGDDPRARRRRRPRPPRRGRG